MKYSRSLAPIAILLLAAACAPAAPTPNDFPPPPWTQIVEFPTPAPALPATSVPRPMAKPIYPVDMAEARTLLLLLQMAFAAGDSGLVAERVLYPIEVRVNGQPATIASAAALEASYDAIFHTKFRDSILEAGDDDVKLTLDGVQVADGALWFHQFCTNSTCTEARFLITQINN